MKKAKYVFMALLLSASVVRVSAANWTFAGSFLNIAYSDTYKDKENHWEINSNAAVISGPELAACVGVKGAHVECGPHATNGLTSHKKLIFQVSTYNNHQHAIADTNYNLSYIK